MHFFSFFSGLNVRQLPVLYSAAFFTQDLVRLGYQDTMATADQVVLFFK